MAERQLPSIDLLRQLLRYEPETGKLFWKERSLSMFSDEAKGRSWNTSWAGKPAMSYLGKTGYLVGNIGRKVFKSHRVAWAIFHGEWPTTDIDHINGDRTDNRINNLRLVTRQDNLRNMGIPVHNSSGHIGVSWSKERHKWLAYINVNRRMIPLGRFDRLEDAVAARKVADKQYGFHKNHGARR
ncbi:HNH endonuclease signature motif containing protein [Brucella intermedia]|uniref:HNH endonuclease signature motif containing protein n=1 Tax=Brucella intermedia TaxID=94625 RepID=UPI00224B47EB|nr:HNH endonuclease signature motif containing protein [Brucella intermedia]